MNQSLSLSLSKQLTNQLLTYSALAGAFTAFSPEAEAQIQYTDIDPDSVYNNSGDTYLLDLNDDGIDDFKISLWESGSIHTFNGEVRVQPLDTNAIAIMQSTWTNNYGMVTGNVAAALATDVSIDSNVNWASNQNFVMGNQNFFAYFGSYNNTYGPWLGTTKFLGLKLKLNGRVHFGWARLYVSSNAQSFRLMDYAWEKQMDQPITAGDTATGQATTTASILEIAALDPVQVQANGKQVTLQLSPNKRYLNDLHFALYNLSGQLVESAMLWPESQQVSLSHVPDGCYVAVIELDGIRQSTKVVLAAP